MIIRIVTVTWYIYIHHTKGHQTAQRVEFPKKNPFNPSTGHYSWTKLCGAVGIGSNQLIRVR